MVQKLRLATLFSLAMFAAGALEAQNLLVNGTFDTSLSGWDVGTFSDQTVTWYPADASGSHLSGSALQQYTGPGNPDNARGIIAQKVPVSPGTMFEFGGKMFPNPDLGLQYPPLFDPGNPPLIGLWFFRSDDSVIDGSKTYAYTRTPGPGFNAVSASAAAPDGAAFARVILFIPQVYQEAVLFDDVFLRSTTLDSCNVAPSGLAIDFTGKTSLCGPSTIGCRAGEEIVFSPVARDYVFQECDAFSWDFGDGTLSSERTPIHAFSSSGVHEVRLTVSNRSGSATAPQVTINDTPSVTMTALPEALVQTTAGGATTTFTLQNIGGSPTTIGLDQSTTIFTQSPSSFTLQPGASQVVTVTAQPLTEGLQGGSSLPHGPGVPSGFSVPMKVFTVAPPTGRVDPVPTSSRIDISLSEGSASAAGVAEFTNDGTATLQALVVSDSPWLIPGQDTVTIPPGGSAAIPFTVDRLLRPDDGGLGSVTGTLSLQFLPGTTGLSRGGIVGTGSPGIGVSPVAVVSTVTPPTSAAAAPAIAAGERAYFIPGIAHVVGSVGTFLSDLNLTNSLRAGAIGDVRMFFRPQSSGSSIGTTAIQVVANQPRGFADIAKNVFKNTTAVGSLQIRSADVLKLLANANVFNGSNPAGTYGTSIPVFRSDRAAAASEQIQLTGLKSDATNHTNLYIQEAAGAAASLRVDFFNSTGANVGSRTESLDGFGLTFLGSSVPPGAVSATVTALAGSAGKVLAYATPVDEASGDTWAVVDWARFFDYFDNSPFLVPVAGALRGANNTYFRTDLAMRNVGSTPGNGTLRYYARNGDILTRPISIGAGQSAVFDDVLGSLFGISTDTVGYLVFTPTEGKFAATSRTYTTVQGSAATYGSGVPTLAADAGIRKGEYRRFGGLEDAALSTVQAARPGTFRTNIGMVETSGNPATVRVTIRFSSGGQRTASQAIAWKDYPLTPRQFLLVSGLTIDILGAARPALGDLHNIQADFEVIDGDGSVVVFTSTLDNGTADSILRVE